MSQTHTIWTAASRQSVLDGLAGASSLRILVLGDLMVDQYLLGKVDRISPDDARSIREGGTPATLRGVEFYNFGAFFSRAYRENDYLWGRLHGAERMIDLVCSTLEKPFAAET